MKRTQTIIAYSIFVALFTISAAAQTSKNSGTFPMPERLKLVGIGEPEPNVSWEYQKYINASFYPIGWSRDGKFAYLLEPADEACGCYNAEIIVQDLKTDKILWKQAIDGNGEAIEPPETLATFWPSIRTKVSAKLRGYGIIPADEFDLIHPAVKLGNDTLTPAVNVDIEHDDVYEVEGTLTVSMASQRSGSKVVSREVYKREDVNAIRNAEIGGILVSPFEKRAAVIVVEEHRGYEGPPNITILRIVGSTLNTGFKKK